jgi:hypothetical protein
MRRLLNPAAAASAMVQTSADPTFLALTKSSPTYALSRLETFLHQKCNENRCL